MLVLINLFLCKTNFEVEINKEINFDSTKNGFSLDYSKDIDIEKASIFILFYEKIGNLIITVESPGQKKPENFTIMDNIGYIFFPFTENGEYLITFNPVPEGSSCEGKFQIVSTDKPFTLDINRDISFRELYVVTELEPYPLIISYENLSENYMKRISDEYEYEIFKISISENGNDFQEVIGDLIYFDKDSNYSIKIEFLESDEEDEIQHYYYINDFFLINLQFNLTKIEDFSAGTKFNKNLKYLFTKINLKDNNNFYVRTDDALKFVYIDDEEDYNNFPNGIQFLIFNDSLINEELAKFEKPKNKDYMILFIEFEYQEMNYIHFAKDVPVELNKVNQFDGINLLFKLNYEKKNSENALLCLFYEFENEKEPEYEYEKKIQIEVLNAINSPKSRSSIENNRDSFNFILENSGEYLILIYSIGTIQGNFTIVSSEYDFTVDAKKEIYFYNDFKENIKFQSILTFSINNIDKYYKKLYSSINNLEDIISYKKNKKEDEDFEPMKNGIFKYEKNDTIIIKLDLKKITSNDHIHISNLDENNISDLEFKKYEFPNPINKIFKINYLSSPYFIIEGDNTNRYFISDVDQVQYDAIDKCLGNLTFNKYNDISFKKPDNIDYSILIVEIINEVRNTDLIINELFPPVNKLNFDSEQKFNSFYSRYELEYEKKGDVNEILLFMYKINENSNNFEISINGPNNFAKTEIFDNKEKLGSYAFESGETGKYEIIFNSEKNFEGSFKIVKASDPIKIDINDNIKLNTFNTTFNPNPITIELNTKGLGDNTYKEFLIGENNNLDLIKISSGDSRNKNLTLNYYAFEKEKEYKIEIEYNDLGNSQFKFDQFIMQSFKFDLEDFQKYGPKTYQNISTTQFIKIDLTKFSKIVVKADKGPIFKIAYYDDDLDMAKILNDLFFGDLKDNTISDRSHKKAVLMIKLKPVETKIDFTDGNGKGNGDNDKNDDDDDNTVFIALGIAGGVIILLIIIFLICRCLRKRAQPDINGGEDKREELMPQTD